MHEFVSGAWYIFDEKILHYLINLKPFRDILLISKAVKLAFQDLLVPFFSEFFFYLVMDRR